MNRNTGRFLAVALVFILASGLCGCESLKKKFIRKTPPKKITPVLMPQDYKNVYPNDVLYNNHFTYWRTWTEDLMDCLKMKGSNKREVLASTRAVEDLQRMQDLLKSPKKEELDKYIKFYQSVQRKVELGQPTDVQAAKMVNDLESRRRVIIRLFDTKEVKPFILQEEEPIKPIRTIEQSLPKE
jgi:hypothetical protein